MRELLFRGSRERLKRNVEKRGGEILPQCRFRLTWRSPYFRRGLAFRIQGRFERREDGLMLTYRFAPTAVTLIWVSAPVLLLLWFAFQEWGNGSRESALAVAAFAALYPVVAIWQAVSCHREFRQCFQVSTK